MRIVLVLLLSVVALPAWAEYWTPYSNTRFGYEIDVPPDFAPGGQSHNGDGQAFYRPLAKQGLIVWGGYVLDSFEGEVAAALDTARADNLFVADWTSTPQWAEFTARRDQRLVFQRMIALCDGASFAAFRIEYDIADLAGMEPIKDGLLRSLRGTTC